MINNIRIFKAFVFPLIFSLSLLGCEGAPVKKDGAPDLVSAEAGEEIEKAPLMAGDVGLKDPTTSKKWQEALSAFNAGDHETALAAVLKVRKRSPLFLEAKILQAKLYVLADDPKSALPLLRDIVAALKGGPDALDTLVYCSLKEKQEGDAILVLETLFEENEGEIPEEYKAALAVLYLKTGEGEAGVKLLGELTSNELKSFYDVDLAYYYLGLGDYKNATKLAQGATKNIDAAEVLLGDLARLQGQASTAMSYYKKVLKRNPKDFSAKVNLGILKLGQGDHAHAATLFREATELNPLFADGWTNLGIALRSGGDYKGANEAYETALKADPNQREALKNMGILQEKYLGRPQEAIAFYERYLKVVGEDKEVSRWLKAAKRTSKGKK
jgi:tetratricopeptide (TPR) repeat protein